MLRSSAYSAHRSVSSNCKKFSLHTIPTSFASFMADNTLRRAPVAVVQVSAGIPTSLLGVQSNCILHSELFIVGAHAFVSPSARSFVACVHSPGVMSSRTARNPMRLPFLLCSTLHTKSSPMFVVTVLVAVVAVSVAVLDMVDVTVVAVSVAVEDIVEVAVLDAVVSRVDVTVDDAELVAEEDTVDDALDEIVDVGDNVCEVDAEDVALEDTEEDTVDVCVVVTQLSHFTGHRAPTFFPKKSSAHSKSFSSCEKQTSSSTKPSHPMKTVEVCVLVAEEVTVDWAVDDTEEVIVEDRVVLPVLVGVVDCELD